MKQNRISNVSIDEVLENSSDLERNYKNEYQKHYIDNLRAIESAIQSFTLMSNEQLIRLVENFNYSSYGKDPKIADALIDELQKRLMDEQLSILKNYLLKIDYMKPWLFNKG